MKIEEAIKSTKFKGERHKVIINILYTAYWLRNHFSIALKECNITLEQYNVLRILRGKHPEKMCVKDIGSRIVEKSSNVPRIIDRLVAKDLAIRTPSKEDKRETLVAITDQGLQLLLQATTIMDRKRDEIMGIDDEAAHELNELLEQMRLQDETDQ
jgi:DNA-binding MarR family transcriptional regulator